MIKKPTFPIYYNIKKRKEKEMFSILINFLQKKHIDLCAAVPLSSCTVTKPYLLAREGISDGSVFIFAIPYFTPSCLRDDRNVSTYAVSKDYHIFFAKLFEECIPLLRSAFPNNRFCAFADHSPIMEVEAAAMGGLGLLGKNGTLITEAYSSYVFLGEIITDAAIPTASDFSIAYCEGCGRCLNACPKREIGQCLSALTQQKGALTDTEADALIKNGIAWGCDICQEVCPHTARAIQNKTIFTPVQFFYDSPISHLTASQIEDMSREEFTCRAYAWRKKETILRNLQILEKAKQKGDRLC